jgi:hypothetical protein
LITTLIEKTLIMRQIAKWATNIILPYAAQKPMPKPHIVMANNKMFNNISKAPEYN